MGFWFFVCIVFLCGGAEMGMWGWMTADQTSLQAQIREPEPVYLGTMD